MSDLAGCTHYCWNEMPKEEVSDQLSRRLVTGERMMLAHVYIKKGCVVPKHQHENEQLTYILEGALKFFLGEDGKKIIMVKAGAAAPLPGLSNPFTEQLKGPAQTRKEGSTPGTACAPGSPS